MGGQATTDMTDTERLNLATDLLREVMDWHADPESNEYNECDTAPCDWCSQARRVIGGERPSPVSFSCDHQWRWHQRDRKITGLKCRLCGAEMPTALAGQTQTKP